MPELAALELQRLGVEFMGAEDGVLIIPDPETQRAEFQQWAQDAQPTLNLSPNGGIPFFLANYIDPKLIKVIFAPMKAAQILGEEKKGDWTTITAQFTTIEHTGTTATYGDFSEDGEVNTNFNFNYFEAYHYQTVQGFGELEVEKAALARVSLVSERNIASTLILNKFQNLSYFFGIAGLKNYGLLNYPNLPASITPVAAWSLPSTDGQMVYEDVRRLYTHLVLQGNGTIDENVSTTLALSPTAAMALKKTNQYNVNAETLIATNFPKLKIITAPEYGNAGAGSTQYVQLIADSIEGQKTATTAYTEKFRAHRVVLAMSSWKRKVSQGTFGTIIFRPFAIASMYGV